MDNERTMRVLKAPSYQIQPTVKVPKVRSYGTRPSPHDRAGTFVSNYVYVTGSAKTLYVRVQIFTYF